MLVQYAWSAKVNPKYCQQKNSRWEKEEERERANDCQPSSGVTPEHTGLCKTLLEVRGVYLPVKNLLMPIFPVNIISQ